MGYSFSATSAQRLQTCHSDIQRIMREVISVSEIDFTIVCGRRGERAQKEAFDGGFSKARFGESPHNADVSLAVDVAPYRDGKIQWDNELLFEELAGTIKAINSSLLEDGAVTAELEWGGNWTNFVDRPHWQIKGWKDLL